MQLILSVGLQFLRVWPRYAGVRKVRRVVTALHVLLCRHFGVVSVNG